MYIKFQEPLYLAFLFSIPILIFIHFYGLKNIKGKAISFVNFKAIARVKGIDLYSKNIWNLVFNILLVILLVFSIAGLTIYKKTEVSGFSFVIAIDSSQSMSAEDLKPNRIKAAKEAAIEFVENLPKETKIGVISFSGRSLVESKLTKDKKELIKSIEEIELSQTGGTDIYEGIVVGSSLLAKEENKAIILLSDGQINVGDIKEAIEYARENEITLHTIAVGSEEGGKTTYGLSKLDKESLTALAYNTGGKFFDVRNKEKLKDSFREIAQISEKLGPFNLSKHLLIALFFLFLIKQYLISINKFMW